ncbi:hypothetical protein ABPG75_010839 [Micractinium tetrahymenae]
MEAAESGTAAAAAPAGGGDALPQALEFGWVPAEVVRALLEEVGNFRARAGAIELLHAAVLDAAREPGAVLPTLSAFLDFLLRLVADANFKIAISAMTILEDLVGLLGADAQPYLGTLAAPLIERLGDNVQMVRQTAAHAIAALGRTLGPTHMLAALGGALVHPSWRVREEGVNAYAAALLSHSKELFDYPACVRALAGAAADETLRVATAALEAFALLHARLGALLQGLLTAAGVPEAVKKAVMERIRQAPALGLPSLDAEGNVQHQPHARPPSAQRPKPAAAAAARPQQAAMPAASPATAGSTASMPNAAAPPAAAPGVQPAVAQVQSLPLAPSTAAAAASLAAPLPEPSAPSAMVAGRAQTVLPPAAAQDPAVACAAVDASGYSWTAAAASAGGASVDASGWSWTATEAAAAAVEFSAPSSSASVGGYGGLALEADGSCAVQRSGGSLLNWQRPARRPNQLSFTGPPARGASGVGGSLTSSSSPGSASLAIVGRGEAAETRPAAQQQQQQQQRSKGAFRGFSLPRSAAAAAVAASAVPSPALAPRRSLPLQPPAGTALQPAEVTASSGPPGTYNADLYSSVRHWQRQQQGSGGLGDGDAAMSDGRGGAAWQDAGLAVEPRSDSLLQWHLPARRGPGSAQQAAAGASRAAPNQPAAAGPAAAPQPSSPARIGSASLKRAFNTISKKFFGSEPAAPGALEQQKQRELPQQQQQQQQGSSEEPQPGSEAWSIAAVRQEQRPPQLQAAVQAAVPAAAMPARPTLSVVVPEAGCQLEGCDPSSPQQESPAADSPDKGAARLSRLKRLSERRRVWSAPLGHQGSQEAAASSEGAQEPCAAAPGGPGAEAAAPQADPMPVGEAAAVTGSDGSPGPRPVLQALKSRARTARALSSGGSMLVPPPTAGGSSGGGYQPYSMEAVDDVFGPDQPVLGSRSSLAPGGGSGQWSPLKTAGSLGSGSLGSGSLGSGSYGSGAFSSGTVGSGSITPPRPSMLLRGASGSGSGSMQWPDSPSGQSGSPARSIWRTGSGALPGSPTAAAAGVSKDGAAAEGAAAFNPASDTSPLAQPEAALQQALSALQAAALSQKKELDWQAQHEALRTVRRLAMHHPGVLAPAATLHALVALAAPVIDALRSTLARLAIAVFQSLAEGLGPALDAELDAFVPLLLKRAGQLSISGRDNFLAVEADRALAALVSHAGEARCAAALLNCLSSKPPDVRAKAAMHLDSCLHQHGSRLVGGSGAGAGCGVFTARSRRAAVALLDEGGLEARTAGKRLLFELRSLLDAAAAAAGGGCDDFKRCLARLECKTDKVWEVLESGRMPTMPARLPSAGLRPPSGTIPSSPTAVPYSPAKPGSAAAGFGAVGSAARLGTASGGSGTGGLMGSSAGARGPSAGLVHAASGGVAALAGALPASKWQPGARPSSMSSPGGSAKGGGGGPGGAAARKGSRPASAGVPGPAPTGSLVGLDAELQQRLEGAAAQLSSSEWKARLEGLEAVQAAVGSQAGALPAEAQLWLADALKERVTDANLKCQQQALAVLNGVMLGGAGAGLAPAAPALLPAICKCLDSGNPSVRQASGQALDAVLATWPPEVHLPLLMSSLGSPVGSARGKEALLERLATLALQLWASQPALLKQHMLPALFALLAAGRRPELRQLAQGALPGLAGLMGGELSAAARASPLLAPAQQVAVAELVSAAKAGGPRLAI